MFKLKSSWEPPQQSVPLETFMYNVEAYIATNQSIKKAKLNLTKHEKQEHRSPKSISNIVIKPTGKGPAVITMERENYISEAEQQLGDTTFHKRLEHDPIQEFQI
ncbi:hypothetical protein DPMN_036991 [Dreissena polymorpha]|uniref:Uncharacterized protein n=1 Tax=Dreissena polymorpha TaxID=45954 RepID=A0A9D4MCM2_DREPO|nr:hypothetical protein DPMN_036991 [Dreissena polymorpha]